MTLGRGLESLIPPQKPLINNQNPKDNLGDNPQIENNRQVKGEENLLSETSGDEPRSRAELTTGQADIEERLPRTELGSGAGSRGQIVFQIETDKIKPNPHQPRRHFDEVALGELANSIREFGIIQPLVVSKVERETDRGWEVSYELVAGERRLLAAKSLGLATVPAIIRQVPIEHEKLELAVTENVQRTNLNPIELARAVAKLQEEFKLTQREIAARLGKSREVIANTLRLLSLPSNIQEAVATGKISESQARLLLSVDDAAAQERIFQEILNDNLTTREVSHRVRQLKVGAPLGARVVDPDLLALKEELESALGAPVELKREGEGGKLTINFYSKEELEGILAKLKQTDSQFLLYPSALSA